MDSNQQRQHCLAKALEYERRAGETLDPIAGRTYRETARIWRELAARAAAGAFLKGE